jgi:hypothetical protein
VAYFSDLSARRRKEQAVKAAQKAAEEARLQHQQAEQRLYRQQMIDLGKESIGFFESLPSHLHSTEEDV